MFSLAQQINAKNITQTKGSFNDYTSLKASVQGYKWAFEHKIVKSEA